MKNKKTLSIFIIFFCLLSIKLAIGEEIIFETPEIEMYENGNVLKAYKGGKAIIDNNTTIIADKFDYSKKTKILSAEGNVEIIDSSNKIITQSNKIIYFKNDEKYFSEGKTKITIDNEYIINSKNVVIKINQNLIYSDENTTANDSEDNYYITEKFRYLVKDKLFRGSNVSLKTINKDNYFFEDVFVNLETKELHGKDLEVNFNNSTFGEEENEPRLKGNKAFSNNDITTVSKGVFTTCKKRPDKKCPPWRIEANEVKHDKNEKTIYYKKAWLKIYDVPVLYYPYFFHPDPTVSRQSGFLAPQIGESQILGSSAYIPYFYVLSDKEDLTFKPRIFSDNKYILQTEYRIASNNSSHVADVSITQGHDSSQSDKDDSRSHFFSNSIIDLDSSVFDVSNLEVQIQKTSNDTYLKLFDLESPLFGDSGSSEVSTLNSFVNLIASREDLDIDASFEVYEKLDSPNSDRYEFIFPSYNLNKNINNFESLKGTLSFNSLGSQYVYNTNIQETKIINDLLYKSENKFFKNGIKNNYNILVKNVNTDGKNSTKYKEKLQTELLSSYIFESSYPLLREGINFNNYLTPKISLRYSPNSMKNLKNENRRIDINNIFSLDRIGSSDTVESGKSLTIGTEYKKSRKKGDLPEDVFELSLATVFRDEINENIPLTSSLADKSSDLVGHIGIEPNEFFNINYNFSMNNNLDKLKYNELITDFKVNNFITSFKYLEESDNIGDEHYLQNTTSYVFDENNSISFSTRKNKKIDLTEFYDLIYQYKNDCLTAAIQYNKEFYSDNDIEPTEQLFFSLTIVPLGQYETKNIIPK